jgi:hypothetical protein
LFGSRIRRAALALAAAAVYPGVAMAQPSNPPSQEPEAKTEPGPAPQAPAPVATAAAPPLDADVAALRDEVRAMRAEMDRQRAEKPVPPAPPPAHAPKPLGHEAFWPWVMPPEGLSTSAYVQTQYESHQDSQSQLAQGGALLNQDRFSIRRARAALLGEWQYAALAVELDANTTSGPQVDLRKAEASLQYRPDRTLPPIVIATMGLFDIPFGYELVESPRTRWFMERSAASRAWFPAEPDLGLRLAGALSFFRWTIAAQNGEPLGEKSPYVLQDPNSSKDVVFRFGFDTLPREDFHVAGDVSALRGRGFSPGTDTTKTAIQWTDQNEDGIVQPIELTPVSAVAATPSRDFDRWAVGADLRMHFQWCLGVAKLYGEVVLAQNLDRGLYIADPVLSGVDQREFGWYVGATQEVTRYGVVGFRYDYYDPNSDAFDKRGGKLVPFSEAISTYSPLFGLVLPDRARLLFQYDINRNALARDASGVPTNLQSNAWTVRLQVQL